MMTLMMVPIFGVFLAPATSQYFLLLETRFVTASSNTFWLIIGTGLLSAIFGTSAAWLTTIYDFKGRKLLSWLLMLPLAIPSYILAYVYVDVLRFSSPLQQVFNSLFNNYISVMSLGGAILLFSLGLYPYVYVVVRSFLRRQSASMFDAARLFGIQGWTLFFRFGLPLLRASIIGSVVLVIMEVLSDFGLVDYFGIVTFTTLIFGSWFRFRQIETALRFSFWLLLVVVLVLGSERLFSNKRRFSYATTKARQLVRLELTKNQTLGVVSYLGSILLFGFGIPVVQLGVWALQTYQRSINTNLLSAIGSTLFVAVVAALSIIVISIFLANMGRGKASIMNTLLLRISMFGYSIPGAVVSVVVLLFFATLDDGVSLVTSQISPNISGILFSSSLIMLLSAYIVRFLAIAYNSIESAYQKVGTNFTNAAYVLGRGKLNTLWTVDVPMILPGITSAFILVVIDIIKELPLTLVLRPFNFNTLATLTYRYAAEEQVAMGAIAALVMILVSSGIIYMVMNPRGVRYGR